MSKIFKVPFPYVSWIAISESGIQIAKKMKCQNVVAILLAKSGKFFNFFCKNKFFSRLMNIKKCVKPKNIAFAMSKLHKGETYFKKIQDSGFKLGMEEHFFLKS